ncbi:MAG: AI-2E family transporter [Abditibacteriales bacterium]|nr:AI-2E family transporter [Abditibacteriales bacterium]MDW8364834.1 AI-2E family transporter [Abditibacteriales bacterium]
MNLERFRTVIFFIMLALALGLCFALVFPFLRLIAWAVVLAVVIYPAHRRLARRVKQPSVAAGLSCLLALLVVGVPVTFIGAAVVDETTRLAKQVQAAERKGELSRWLPSWDTPAVRAARRWLEQRVDLSQLSLESVISQTVGQVSSFLAKQSVAIVKNVVWVIVQVALTLVTLFFLLRDTPRLMPVIREFMPLNAEQTDVLLRRAADTIYATVYGATAVAVTQGTLGGLAFWALGLPSPLLWGAVMTVLCFVPLLGAPVVWVPTVVVLAAQGAYGKAIALALWGMLVIGLVDNFIRPIVIGARTQLHILLVFFSVLGGLLLMGPLGLLMGPVILAVTLALLDVLKMKLAEGQQGEEEG